MEISPENLAVPRASGDFFALISGYSRGRQGGADFGADQNRHERKLNSISNAKKIVQILVRTIFCFCILLILTAVGARVELELRVALGAADRAEIEILLENGDGLAALGAGDLVLLLVAAA